MNAWDDLTQEQQKQVDALLFGGQKIEAIKAYREWAGVGLKEGKEAVDAREAELRKQSPELFAGRRSGCSAVMLLVFLVAFVICAAARAEDLVDNPEYMAWSSFKPGTSVARRIEFRSPGQSSTMEVTERLVGVSGDRLTLEVTTTLRQQTETHPTETHQKDIPARIAKSQASPTPGVPADAQGQSKALPDEDVAVVDKTYRCQVMSFVGKEKGLNLRGTTWTSAAIPGRIVRSEMHAEGQIMTKGAEVPVEGITTITTITALDVKQ